MLYRLALLVWVCTCPLAWFSPLLYVLTAGLVIPLAFYLLVLRLRLPRAPESNARNFRNLVIAHRGGQSQAGSAAGVFPENSLAAFRWCSSPECGGADAFELDVWLSKDGVPMVNHDPAVFRHFAGDGWINEMTCRELQELKYLKEPHLPAVVNSADNAYEKQSIKTHRTEIDDKYIESERMPTLEEVVHLLETEFPHMRLMIEVKERTHIDAMCRALKDLYDRHPWMESRCFIAAFHPLVLRRMRQLDRRVVTSFLFIADWSHHLLKNARDMKIHVPWYLAYNYPLRWLLDDLIWAAGTTALGLSVLGANLSAVEVKCLTESQIRRDRANGIVTSTWVANNHQQKEWLLQQGVTVITDTCFQGGSSTAAPRPQATW